MSGGGGWNMTLSLIIHRVIRTRFSMSYSYHGQTLVVNVTFEKKAFLSALEDIIKKQFWEIFTFS